MSDAEFQQLTRLKIDAQKRLEWACSVHIYAEKQYRLRQAQLVKLKAKYSAEMKRRKKGKR